MSEKKKDFAFEAFQQEAIERLKAGDSAMGKKGQMNPLSKHFLDLV